MTGRAVGLGRYVWAHRHLGALVALSVGLAAGGWGAGSASAAGAGAAPRLVVEEAEMDAGVREPGPKVEFVFRLKNTGAAPLKIIEAKGNCGCVAAAYDREIAPGGTGTVTAVLDTAERIGMEVKHLTVVSNDPENPTVVLTIKAQLRRAVEVGPSSELLFPLKRGKGSDVVITLYSFEQAPLKILKVTSPLPYVRAEILPAETGRMARERTASRGSRCGSACFRARRARHLRLRAGGDEQQERPRVELSVNGYPEGAVMAFPSRIYFPDLPAKPEDAVLRPITLMKSSGTFKIVSAQASDPALRLQVMQDPADALPRSW